jgi:hypothetical protein
VGAITLLLDSRVVDMEATKHLRVNVGAGDYPMNGFTNIDSCPLPAVV